MNQKLKDLAKKYKVRLTRKVTKTVKGKKVIKRVKKSEQLVKTQVNNAIKRSKSSKRGKRSTLLRSMRFGMFLESSESSARSTRSASAGSTDSVDEESSIYDPYKPKPKLKAKIGNNSVDESFVRIHMIFNTLSRNEYNKDIMSKLDTLITSTDPILLHEYNMAVFHDSLQLRDISSKMYEQGYMIHSVYFYYLYIIHNTHASDIIDHYMFNKLLKCKDEIIEILNNPVNHTGIIFYGILILCKNDTPCDILYIHILYMINNINDYPSGITALIKKVNKDFVDISITKDKYDKNINDINDIKLDDMSMHNNVIKKITKFLTMKTIIDNITESHYKDYLKGVNHNAVKINRNFNKIDEFLKSYYETKIRSIRELFEKLVKSINLNNHVYNDVKNFKDIIKIIRLLWKDVKSTIHNFQKYGLDSITKTDKNLSGLEGFINSIIEKINKTYSMNILKIDDSLECPVCFEDKKQLFTFNCMHYTCEDCYHRLDEKCPICRADIKNIRNVTMFFGNSKKSANAKLKKRVKSRGIKLTKKDKRCNN